ncbi:hypothetical protein NLJ89_g10742 [Agrocybe chaxingu]|uniref:Uncharacterized protein n=1 Tax=Agrocybe chaxingu TaxID=84603 RepID=A0A9W8JQJ6_9AGAR|nr:hypothetical protein NLJ89_g10742 [Agrocybe chaxingu]
MFDDGSDSVSAPLLRPPLHNTSSPRDKEPVGFEKLLKWQDERRARKLKGEYESAVTHLSEVDLCGARGGRDRNTRVLPRLAHRPRRLVVVIVASDPKICPAHHPLSLLHPPVNRPLLLAHLYTRAARLTVLLTLPLIDLPSPISGPAHQDQRTREVLPLLVQQR